jgi:hypothetical protein
MRLQQQDNSATWDYVGDTDPESSSHGGTQYAGDGDNGGLEGSVNGSEGGLSKASHISDSCFAWLSYSHPSMMGIHRM